MDIRVYNDLALQGALVFEKNEAGFPSNPRIGTFIIKDQCLFGYIKIGGLETWYPFASKTNSYVHTQGVNGLVWVVSHNLGTTNVWYQVRDNNGQILSVGKSDVDNNSFQLNFTEATRGTVVVVAPDTIDVPQVKATMITVGGAVEIDSSGVYINGEMVLTDANISAEIAAAVAPKADKATTYTKTETDARIQAVVGAAPAALDTLQEVAEQLAANETAATALTNLVSTKADISTTATKTELASGLATKSSVGHTHVIADVSGLQAALDSKSNASDIPANATQLVSGFMSAEDKSKLDAIESGALGLASVQSIANAAKTQAINTAAADATAKADAAQAAAIADANTKVAAETSARNTALDLKAPLANPTFTGTVGGITKAMVGLGNVDNTADSEKPVSTAQQTALDLKAPVDSPTFTGTVSGVTKAMVGLGNVDNTADSEKPVSTAQQTALDLKAPLTGTGASGTWGISVTGTASNVTGIVAVANGGTGATSNTAARTNLGATTVGSNLFTLTNPTAVSFLRVNADNTVSSLDAAAFRTAIGAGTGTVTTTGTDTLTNKTISGGVYSGVVDQTGSVRGGVTAVAALNIDCSLGNYFTKTISANSTFTVSNVPSSRAYAFTLELTHTSGTVTWFSGVQWPGGTAPTLTTGKVHLFTFVTDDGGTSWRGVSQVNYNS